MFIVEYNTWEKEKNLENTKESIVEFEKRINTEVSMLLLILVVAITSQKINNNISNKFQDRYQVGTIRKLNKESLMYCYPIYKIDIWSVLTINNLTLMSIHYS